MSPRPLSWIGPLKVLLGTIAVLCGLYVFFLVGPALETRFFPVLGKMRFTEVLAQTKDASIVRTEFEKLRSCEYMGIAWYYGAEAGVFERVSMVPIRDPNDTSSPSRPVGIARAGPWRITIPAADVRTKSFVEAFHRCHPFWTTVSKFYP
ncbi:MULTISPECIES: hypothetical protein [unclassified Aureimonas]|uniref:hypothetical protein n=1 Tax=unclassified Aureimonas TaxID=2615206 RepID=UPI0006F283B0|nr:MULTISPECIES: hypothetical protein [unclassified Aureimonas]KQT52239.1 hypothetical protein ASG62_16405 [Aureimonas sp. Leaf427]KQT70527.1 hypothetical protein ASG54_21545 [Aureimonas sp. Leaf460]